MHGNLDLLLTLTSGLSAALVFGYITHRLGLSPIVGYLLAGIVVGPNTPGFIANRALADQLAEIGVILLMFGVGMHFHLKELLAVRRIALPGAIFQSLVATILGALATHALGWSWAAGLVYGLSISVASTVVLVRVLADNNDLHTPSGHIAVGWLVVEDLFTVLVLVLLPAFFGGQKSEEVSLSLTVGVAAIKILVLVALVFLLGGRFIPFLLEKVAATRSRELFTLTVLVVALGIAVGSARLFGVSMALGAFLAGMVVGRSDFSLRAATDSLPMQDAFAVLFFVSVGMLFDPSILLASPGLVAITLVIIVLGKPLAALVTVLVMGYPIGTALAVSVSLAQIGEFSFILAALGRTLNILPPAATNVLVAAAIVSISLNPLLYRLVDPLDAWIARHPLFARWRKWLLAGRGERTGEPDGEQQSASHRAVIVGYGPIGKTLSSLLRRNEIEPTIIEMNLETVKALRAKGFPAVYGDATHRDTLKAAQIDQSETLILSASALRNAHEIIRAAREFNPDVRVLVRSNYLRDAHELQKAGADQVFSGEGEVALAMMESVMRELGATGEQIDRESERVRVELFGVARDRGHVAASTMPNLSSAEERADEARENEPTGVASDAEPNPDVTQKE